MFMLLNLKYPGTKKHDRKRRCVNFQLPYIVFFWMFEAGKFEVLIPVGIPGEGMLGTNMEQNVRLKQVIFRWTIWIFQGCMLPNMFFPCQDW